MTSLIHVDLLTCEKRLSRDAVGGDAVSVSECDAELILTCKCLRLEAVLVCQFAEHPNVVTTVHVDLVSGQETRRAIPWLC